jgi:hypothetical protein
MAIVRDYLFLLTCANALLIKGVSKNPQDHNPHEPSTLPMSASKPPVPKYRIIKGTRSDITSEDSKAVVKAEAAEYFGVVSSRGWHITLCLTASRSYLKNING